jgi:hypothetical protein
MKHILINIFTTIRRNLCAIIVAYMMGIHNFYKGEEKSPENIVTIELNEKQDNSSS